MDESLLLYDEDDAPEVDSPEQVNAALFVESLMPETDNAQEQTDKVPVHDRMGYIGGSDAPVIVGASPWKTPFELYLEKTGQKPADDLSGNERVYWGTVLEEIVAREYARQTDNKIRKVNRLIRDKQHSFLAAHIDRNVLQKPVILECKTAGIRQAAKWGEPGTDEIPDHYMPQVQHMLMVTGAEACDVAVLIGGNEFRLYAVPRDEEYITYLRKLELDFWQHVTSERPPEVNTYEDARMAWPHAVDGAVEADEEAYQAAVRLQQVTAQEKELEAEEKELKKLLMSKIADRGTTLLYNGQKLATWKEQAGRETVDNKKLKAEYPDVYADCVKIGEPFRVFRAAKLK
jgi:putative phage-type endonuclease